MNSPSVNTSPVPRTTFFFFFFYIAKEFFFLLNHPMLQKQKLFCLRGVRVLLLRVNKNKNAHSSNIKFYMAYYPIHYIGYIHSFSMPTFTFHAFHCDTPLLNNHLNNQRKKKKERN
ncbi:hypothetical protein BDF21DRAFT_104002 [Thamnidium elegans]|nr:hypothetical protein BDF21DRAFT_104002 [Thamnidium elegans]